MTLPVRFRLLWPWQALRQVATMCAPLMLLACGGGGGGGDSQSGTPAAVMLPGNGFPIGVTATTALGLSGGQLVSGADSALPASIANGERSLHINVFDLAALFQAWRQQGAPCYGPAVAYTNHDDGTPGNTGTLAAGGVGMWRDTEQGVPCAAAQATSQLPPLTQALQQALMLSAALRRVLALNGSGALPDPGTTRDVRGPFVSAISGWPASVLVPVASVQANGDASVYRYRLVLQQGSGAQAETIEISLLHTPNDTSTRFAGVLRLIRGYLSSDASLGCSDTVDLTTGRYKVSDVRTLGYNRFDNFLSLRARAAHYCGADLDVSADHFGNWVTPSGSGELDHTQALSGATRGQRNGWRAHLLRYSADIDLNNQNGDFLWGWQAAPAETTSRFFALHVDNTAASPTALAFHAFGDTLLDSDGVLVGMYCNWNGPNPSGTPQAAFQRQTLRLSGGAWQLQQSDIAYGPTNNCQASTAMRFDSTGLGTLNDGLGAASDRLARPSGGRTDVQSEITEQGYWMPLLF